MLEWPRHGDEESTKHPIGSGDRGLRKTIQPDRSTQALPFSRRGSTPSGGYSHGLEGPVVGACQGEPVRHGAPPCYRPDGGRDCHSLAAWPRLPTVGLAGAAARGGDGRLVGAGGAGYPRPPPSPSGKLLPSVASDA